LALRLLEAAVVAIAAVQIARIALKPPFRRDMAAIPALAIAGVALALAMTALGLWLMRRWPVILDLTAFISVIGLAAAWWRARPAYGRRRGWPSGSLGVGASLDAIDDRDFYSDQARIHGPVFKMSQFGRPVVCVVGLERGRDLLKLNTAALAGASLPYDRFVPRGTLRYMAGEDHRRKRRRRFAPRFPLAPSPAKTSFVAVAAHAGLPVNRSRCRCRRAGQLYVERWVFVALSRVFRRTTDPRMPN
jgi:hypothetical protein